MGLGGICSYLQLFQKGTASTFGSHLEYISNSKKKQEQRVLKGLNKSKVLNLKEGKKENSIFLITSSYRINHHRSTLLMLLLNIEKILQNYVF